MYVYEHYTVYHYCSIEFYIPHSELLIIFIFNSFVVPSGPVRNIQRPSLTSTAVRLTWSEPSANHINSPGGITQYFVELRNKETSNRCGDTVHMQQTVSQDSRVVTFNNLTPFTEYCIRIYPENSFGRAREASVRSGDYTFSTQESGECV